MDANPVEANAKPGAYPYADRANLYGTFLIQYYNPQMDEVGLERAFNGLLTIAWPKARRDKEFVDLYDSVTTRDGRRQTLKPEDRTRLVIELTRVMDDLGTWDWRPDPQAEATLDGET